MLTALKYYIKMLAVPALYFVGLGISIFSIFKEAKWGLLLLVVLVSQPNVWYKYAEMPLGKDFLDVLFVSVCLGMIVQRTKIAWTTNSTLVLAVICYSYLSVWNSSARFGLAMPIGPSSWLLLKWKNYVEMIVFYFLALNVVREERDQKMVVVCMSIVILIISVRCFRSFSAVGTFDYTRRLVGPFYAVGLGSNHLGAFIAEYAAAILGLLLFEKERKRKALFVATCLFAMFPLLFSYSRGAYLAFLGALGFLGVVGKRILLVVVLLLGLLWQVVLPESVVDRISMTTSENGELEESAGMRIVLWDEAIAQFMAHPFLGSGFDGFSLAERDAVHGMRDTHNYYVKVLAEGGIIGFILLICSFACAFRSGFLLRVKGGTAFQRGLGLGFMACVIATMIANFFGDRFSYFSIGSFFWILWGLVDRGILLAGEPKSGHSNKIKLSSARVVQ